MNKGFYLMWRGWMNHPRLKTKNYTKREAFCWLIENSAWEDHCVDWNGKTIKIKRGELPTSLRTLAREWGWSQNRILRFLTRLKSDSMLEASTEAGFYIIRVCNYKKYQNGISDGGSETEAVTEAGSEANIKKGKERKRNKERKRSLLVDLDGKSESLQSVLPLGEQEEQLTPKAQKIKDGFDRFFKIFPKKFDKPQAWKAWELAVKRADMEIIIAGAKAYAEERALDLQPNSAKYTRRPANWLNNDSWLNFDQNESEQEEIPISEIPVEKRTKEIMRRMGKV